MSKNTISLGLVITVYDLKRINFFKDAINSVISQTVPYDEIIIISDNPLVLAEEFVDFVIPSHVKIKFISNKVNIGPALSRSRGASFCNTDYVQYFDDDDILNPVTCETIKRIACNTNSDIIYFGLAQFTKKTPDFFENKNIHIRTIFNPLYVFPRLPSSNVLCARKKSLITITEKHFKDYNIKNITHAEDLLTSFFSAVSASSLSITNETLYYYRRHSYQSISEVSTDKVMKKWNDVCTIIIACEKILNFKYPNHNTENILTFLVLSLGNFFYVNFIDRINDENIKKAFEKSFLSLNYNRNNEFETIKKYIATNRSIFSLKPGITPYFRGVNNLKPSVSVIIPLYNSESTISYVANSLKRQTLNRNYFEVIIIDDASTDNSISICEEEFKDFSNYKIIKLKENKGQGIARNEGIGTAKGNYIFFLDSDDAIEPITLELLLNTALLERSDVTIGCLTGTFPKINPSPDISIDDRRLLLSQVLSHKIPLAAAGKLYSYKFLIENEIKFPSHRHHEDTFFTFQALFYAKKIKLNLSARYLVTSRPNSNSRGMSERQIINYLEQYDLIKKIILQLPYISLLYPSYRTGLKVLVEKLFSRIFLFEKDTEKQLNYVKFLIKEASKRDVIFDKSPIEIKNIVSLLKYNSEKTLDFYHAMNTARKKYKPANVSVTLPNIIEGSSSLLSPLSEFIFICEADYHIRHASLICTELQLRGRKSIIYDLSSNLHGGCRASKKEDNDFHEIVKIDKYPKFSDLKGVQAIFFYVTHGLMQYNAIAEYERGGHITVSIVEGICDFDNVDTFRFVSPYKNTKYVFLAGWDDLRFFSNYSNNSFVIGNPNIDQLLTGSCSVTPQESHILLNMNFTYGVFENKSVDFLKSVAEVCFKNELPLKITVHPMDKTIQNYASEFVEYIVSQDFYSAVAVCKVFVSRFGTGILEALALGVPVVYFNPHGEKVDKFLIKSSGVISVANSKNELLEAISSAIKLSREPEWFEKVAIYLNWHCGVFSSESPVEMAVQTIQNLFPFKERISPCNVIPPITKGSVENFVKGVFPRCIKSPTHNILIDSKEYVESSQLFDGEKYFSSEISLPEQYFIDLCLENFDEVTSELYDEFTPPMPFKGLPIIIYKLPGRFRIMLDNKENLDIEIPYTKNRIRITCFINEYENSVDVFINELWVGMIYGFWVKNNKIIIGKGFNNRFWKGKINRINILKGHIKQENLFRQFISGNVLYNLLADVTQ